MSIKLLSAEQAVEMAHKLYEMRRAAKQIDGDKYPASIEVHLEAIRRLEKKDGEGYLSAFIRLAKDVTDKFGAGGAGTVLRLAAAAMELMVMPVKEDDCRRGDNNSKGSDNDNA
jgi:hypothetical protein